MVNEKIVLLFYLEQIDADTISFLQDRDEHKQVIRKLIEELASSETMHERVHIAKNLWKALFEASLTYIDPDRGGYDKLFKFFDEYVQFEELIFASDAFYRDHTIHCLWVYFLGEYLYRRPEFRFIIKAKNEKNHNFMQFIDDIEKLNMHETFSGLTRFWKLLEKVIKNEDSLRCLAALTHDLGYPLKKISKINTSISKILPYFAIDKYTEFDFSYNDVNTLFVREFLERMSLEPRLNFAPAEQDDEVEIMRNVMKVDSGTNGTRLNEEAIKRLLPDELKILKRIFTLKLGLFRSTSHYLRYAQDFEQREHGILSAFLLMKTLSFFAGAKLTYADRRDIATTEIDIPKIFSSIDILKAIADHTSSGYQIRSIDTSSSLLTFVDELEEFSRISRANLNREFINEFCHTDLYVDGDALNVDFIFDNANIESLNPEVAFTGRCKKMLRLLAISELDPAFKLRLRCVGKLPTNSNVYTLEVSRKYARITINSEEVSIPKYLKSREFCTREEYMSL